MTQLQIHGLEPLAVCKRCGIGCSVDHSRPRAPAPPQVMGSCGGAIAPFRKATVPDGLCATCAVREWFYLMRYELPCEVRPASLLLPQIQAQFGAILHALGVELELTAIDWPRLVAEWDLPIPSIGKGIDKRLRKMDEDPMWARSDEEMDRRSAKKLAGGAA